MQKRLFLVLAGIFSLFCVMGIYSQTVTHEEYIHREFSVADVYSSWNAGSATTVNPDGYAPSAACAEDENFFIGRVKMKKRFTNANTQVNTSLNPKRKVLWWCPMTGDGWTSLPRYMFNSEVYSTWSYTDTHGCWTNGLFQLPGAFSDVTHKNGVANAIVSQPAWAANLATDGNGAIYAKFCQNSSGDGAAKLLGLLRYYGIDGIGFNSECNFNVTVNGVALTAGMQNLFDKMHGLKTSYNWEQLHFDWYDGVRNDGAQSFGSNQLDGTNNSWFHGATNKRCNGFFLNYNWSSAQLSASVSAANAFGPDKSYDVYAGQDWQGRGSAPWTSLQNYPISIGIWGAHNKNMPYETSASNGSSGDSVQVLYQRKMEHVFTGSTKNPVNTPALTDSYNYSGNPSNLWAGFSKLVPAKSVYSWTANAYFPFITYFNLGNGKFLNNQGVTTFATEWYNIGMQDYLPTWRWWITKSFMGRTSTDVPNGFTAKFTWEDAWFGGSCMKISGASGTSSYVHLFKTQYPLTGTGVTFNLGIRYKVLKGTAGSMSWACSAEGAEATEIGRTIASNLTAANEWKFVNIQVKSSGVGVWQALSGKILAMMALKFANTSSDFEILIGEVSLVRAGVTYNPLKPTITGPFAVAAAPQDLYCKPVGNMTNGGRKLNSLSFSGSDASSLVVSGIQPSSSSPVYVDKTTSVLQTTAGATITPTMNWDGDWMHTYLYIDVDKNNTFSTTLTGAGGIPAGNDELVMFSYRNNINSLGAAATNHSIQPVAFKIPTGLPNGKYRARFKIDWDTLDPCGSSVVGNTIQANGGCVVDFTIQIGPAAPVTPTINPIKRVTYLGTDFKLIFKSKEQTDPKLPVYNEEADTWYFEIWSQQQGKDEILCTYTTSWAAYVISAPFDVLDVTNNKIRFGVRAVAPDGVTKSEMAWTEMISVAAADIKELHDVQIDKPVIKVNETFTISFKDPTHGNANKWEIINSTTGAVVKTFTNCKTFTTSLTALGSYDLKLTLADNTVITTPGMIQVSIPQVGAMPKIFDFVVDKSNMREQKVDTIIFNRLTDILYSYTGGRQADAVAGTSADGTVSKAVKIEEKTPIAIDGKFLPYDQPITIAFWMKVDDVSSSDQFNFMALRTRNNNSAGCMGCWAFGNYGAMWATMNKQGLMNVSWRGATSSGVTFGAGSRQTGSTLGAQIGCWTHVCVTFKSGNNGRIGGFYFNGRYSSVDKSDIGTNLPDKGMDGFKSHRLYIGGTANDGRAGLKATIDDLQIWHKELTAAEVLDAMQGYSHRLASIPNELVGYWNFETVEANNTFTNLGRPFTTTYTGSSSSAYGTRTLVPSAAVVYEGDSQSWSGGATSGTALTTVNGTFPNDIVYAPVIVPGNPALVGTFPIVTAPSWNLQGASTGTRTGNATAGSATVQYTDDQMYEAEVTLANSWGSDTKKIRYIKIYDWTTDLEQPINVEASVYPNPFVEAVYMKFSSAGKYTVDVYTLAGQLVTSKSEHMQEGELVQIIVPGNVGVYLLKVRNSEGKVLRTVKVEKK